MIVGAPVVVAMLALLLASCSADVRSLRLADVDLADMEVVQEIRRGLPPEDRALFSTYVVKHVATSRFFCGEALVNGNGKEPGTIREAIALTALREDELRRQRIAAKRPLTAAESLRREHVRLEGTKEALIARQTHLYSIHGPAAQQLPEWDSINDEMEEADAQLQALKQKLDAAAS